MVCKTHQVKFKHGILQRVNASVANRVFTSVNNWVGEHLNLRKLGANIGLNVGRIGEQ